MAKIKSLSEHFPTAIRQAVTDLRVIRKNKQYVIDMRQWHLPLPSGKCAVCFAGAVMSRRLAMPLDVAVWPGSPFCKGDKSRIFLALDMIRKGIVPAAIHQAEERTNTPYTCSQYCRDNECPMIAPWLGDNPPIPFEEWCKEVLAVADWLDKHWANLQRLLKRCKRLKTT